MVQVAGVPPQLGMFCTVVWKLTSGRDRGRTSLGTVGAWNLCRSLPPLDAGPTLAGVGAKDCGVLLLPVRWRLRRIEDALDGVHPF